MDPSAHASGSGLGQHQQQQPQRQRQQRQDGGQQLTPSSAFVQVCDRCRWKKIKCDGARPCSNCRNANFPCETRARLSKQATPRSYVQYLEARVRQLEGNRESEWSPQESSTKQSPYSGSNARSSEPAEGFKKPNLPDWTILKELGTHVVDEDGLSRYMGPSSGVDFATKVLQEVFEKEPISEDDYHALFSLDDLNRGRALQESDELLWQLDPTELPPRDAADHVLNLFFLFTERVFPLLHRPTFLGIVDELYNLKTIDLEHFEALGQFYFCLAIGYSFEAQDERKYQISNQIRAIQSAARCYYTTLHRRIDGLMRVQTICLYSYALVQLRQRSQALRMSAMANVKALECGLHHDGTQFHGNPLETQMRRRVFWCVFMLHLFNSALAGLPRALHTADVTIAEPADVDDDQLTTTEILNSLPGRTKIHRFVSIVRLCRILSRALDVLYTHTKRKHASTRITQMNRLCCEHLLDQLDFSFDETPDDMPEPDSEDPADMAILASYANEQTLYHYIRWLVHRPGLTFPQTEPYFAQCLQTATEAAASILQCANMYKRVYPLIKLSPAAHPSNVFVAALTPVYRTWLVQNNRSGGLTMPTSPAEADLEACLCASSTLEFISFDHSDVVRRRILQTLIGSVFGQEHEELKRMDSIKSNPGLTVGEATMSPISPSFERASQSQGTAVSQASMDYGEDQIEHYTAHEDLRSFVHEAFSPGMGGQWSGDPYFTSGDKGDAF